MKPKRYIHQDVIVSVFFILAGCFFFFGANSFPTLVGLFPRVFSVLLIGLSIYTLVIGIKRTKELNEKIANGEDITPEISAEKLKTPLMSFTFIVFYAIAFTTIGFFVATTVFLLGYMYYLNMRKWGIMLGVTLGFDLMVYLLFVRELGTRLPKGLLF